MIPTDSYFFAGGETNNQMINEVLPHFRKPSCFCVYYVLMYIDYNGHLTKYGQQRYGIIKQKEQSYPSHGRVVQIQDS